MNTHWTERSAEDYVFAIGADFVAQLEDKMEDEGVSQNALAERIGITKGRVSQVFNHPGNLTLSNVVKYTRALGMKASIIAYEDSDPENKKGPINPKIFQTCWERCGKPHDFWDVENLYNDVTVTVSYGVQMAWQALAAVVWYGVSFSYGSPFGIAVAGTGYEQEYVDVAESVRAYNCFQSSPLNVLPASKNKAIGEIL
jgi:antitoxin component HigA of HigAB toxin-antitoxin module